MIEDCCLAVLAKAPIAGQVKTRLTPFLTEKQACLLHQSMIEFVFTELKAHNPELWITAPHPWFSSLKSYSIESCYQQVDGDLGRKMFAMCEHYLAKNISPIIIGTDCPFITYSYIEQAKQALQQSDVVIGPASDGGYVLIAFNADHPAEYYAPVFENIAWGSAEVFNQTLEALKALNLAYIVLPEQHDIDRPDDLALLKQHKLAQKLPFLR